MNCVADSLQKPVGSEVGKGDISPWRMLSSTVTDELELFTQKRSKVIGISSKDRGAVLPAGHMADAAYWYDGKNGNFISSTFYMTQLPEWLVQFNSQDLPQKYLTQDWTTLLPVEKYTESGPDETPYERQYAPSIKSSFPYKFSLLKGKLSPEFLGNTPFADDLLTELAKAVIVNERMGKDEITDFLCISFSAPDAVGHRVGPNAVEIEDTYLRLDKNIEDLLKNLDQQVGAGNYTLFLTADHAVADVPQYLKDNKVPAGYFNESNLLEGLESISWQVLSWQTFHSKH